MSLATPLRTLTVAAVLAALALPAAAASVKVNVAGLDAKAAHNQIHRAAEQVCSAALNDEPLSHYLMADCIEQTVATTEAKFAANDRRLAQVQNGR